MIRCQVCPSCCTSATTPKRALGSGGIAKLVRRPRSASTPPSPDSLKLHSSSQLDFMWYEEYLPFSLNFWSVSRLFSPTVWLFLFHSYIKDIDNNNTNNNKNNHHHVIFSVCYFLSYFYIWFFAACSHSQSSRGANAVEAAHGSNVLRGRNSRFVFHVPRFVAVGLVLQKLQEFNSNSPTQHGWDKIQDLLG